MKNFLLLSFLVLFVSCNKDKATSSIEVVGQMRDVMWKGQLAGKIATDSIDHPTSYGLGPIEYLKGEVMLFEGQTYTSQVRDSLSHIVTPIKSAKAPFFVYSRKSDLRELPIAGKNLSLNSLEQLIDSLYLDYDHPLLLRIDGVFEGLTVHSVNLAPGSVVTSPNDAHEGMVNYRFENISGSIICFFSRKHKAIFTHHDSYLHAHFISDDRTVMGHVDAVFFDSNKSTFSVSK